MYDASIDITMNGNIKEYSISNNNSGRPRDKTSETTNRKNGNLHDQNE